MERFTVTKDKKVYEVKMDLDGLLDKLEHEEIRGLAKRALVLRIQASARKSLEVIGSLGGEVTEELSASVGKSSILTKLAQAEQEAEPPAFVEE